MSDYNGDAISESEWFHAEDEEFERDERYGHRFDADPESDDPLSMAINSCRDE